MCIIAGEVQRVAGTKLFVMPNSRGTRQITVYSNRVDTSETNMMCLPVPNPASVSFETVYDTLFADCKKSFTFPRIRSLLTNEDSFVEKSADLTPVYLPVKTHGSYEVVLVPSITEDLDRVPPGFLILTDDVKCYLRTHYSSSATPFGVIFCKLRAGSVGYEPFAYSHDLLPSGKLFLPTRHYHIESKIPTSIMGDIRDPFLFTKGNFGLGPPITNGGAGSVSLGTFDASSVSSALLDEITKMDRSLHHPHPVELNSKIADDWDHEIFTLMTDLETAHNTKSIPNKINSINWSKMPSDYHYGESYPLRSFERFGIGPNEDLQFAVSNKSSFFSRLIHQLKLSS